MSRQAKVTEQMIAHAALNPKVRFAFLPRRLNDGSLLWMEHYVRAPSGLYIDEEFGRTVLRQFRVEGAYFPHGNYAMEDDSYLDVKYVEQYGMTSFEFLTLKAGELNV